ncbi:hypothetical protein [Zhihengliuella sp.]|uniref:Trm112 family protein n=1 Tax=Zhihengliuella sp. TaxID=1954483 RepID=UPI002810F0A2|nr:hypothetical protein [Zhihengliuella sp.]
MAHISVQLLADLRCPATGSALALDGDYLVSVDAAADGERLRYPIVDGIPVLLPPETAAPAS